MHCLWRSGQPCCSRADRTPNTWCAQTSLLTAPHSPAMHSFASLASLWSPASPPLLSPDDDLAAIEPSEPTESSEATTAVVTKAPTDVQRVHPGHTCQLLIYSTAAAPLLSPRERSIFGWIKTIFNTCRVLSASAWLPLKQGCSEHTSIDNGFYGCMTAPYSSLPLSTEYSILALIRLPKIISFGIQSLLFIVTKSWNVLKERWKSWLCFDAQIHCILPTRLSPMSMWFALHVLAHHHLLPCSPWLTAHCSLPLSPFGNARAISFNTDHSFAN